MTGTVNVLIAVIWFLLKSFVFAKELALQNLPHSISEVSSGFAAYLFVIVADRLQDSKVFVALVYVIYLTLW